MKKRTTLALLCVLLLTACAASQSSESISVSTPASASISNTSLPAIPNGNNVEWREETFTLAGKTVTLQLPFYIHLWPSENRMLIEFDEEFFPEGMLNPSDEIVGGFLGSILFSANKGKIPLEKVDENTYSYQVDGFEYEYIYTRADSICVDPPTFYELGDYFIYSDTLDLPSTTFMNLNNSLRFNFLHENNAPAELKTLFETIVLSAQVQ